MVVGTNISNVSSDGEQRECDREVRRAPLTLRVRSATCTRSVEAPLHPRPESPAVKRWHHLGPRSELRQARGRSPTRVGAGRPCPREPGKARSGPRGAGQPERNGRCGRPAAAAAHRFPIPSSGLRSPLLAGPAARSQASSGARFSPLPLMSLPTAPALPENALHAPTTAPSFESTLLFVQISIC